MGIPCEESKYRISQAYKFIESTRDGFVWRERIGGRIKLRNYSNDDLEFIGDGTNGNVYRLVLKTTTIYAVGSDDENEEKFEAVAIKTKRGLFDLDEVRVDKLLKDKGIVCDNMIRFKVLENKSVSMPLTDGDLKSFLEDRELTPSQASEIVKSLAETLHCLTEKGVYYFDIKLSNILYRCDRGNIRIYLGDLGSMIPFNEKYSYTYLPIEYQDIGIKSFSSVKEEIIVYLLCCLYFSMVNIDSYNNFQNVSVDNDYREELTNIQGRTAVGFLQGMVNYEGRDEDNKTDQIYRGIMMKYIRSLQTVGKYGKSEDRDAALKVLPNLRQFISLLKKRSRPPPVLKCPLDNFSYVPYSVINDVTSEGGEIMYNGKFLTKKNYPGYYKEEIVSGTYGTISKISINNSTSFILKESLTRQPLDEVQALKKIGDLRSCPGLISTKIISPFKVVMPVATGDLQDFKGKVIPKQADYIVTLISKSLQCLLDSGIYYFDMKLANVLYRCTSSAVEIYLGDLGSVIPKMDDYMATYPPLEFYTGFIPKKELTPEMVARIYTYQMCVMYYSLLGESIIFILV